MNRMLSAALAAATLASVSSIAHAADFVCEVPHVTFGSGNAGRDPVTALSINFNPGSWNVVYTLASGTVVRRNDQYGLSDISKDGWTEWGGRLRKVPKLLMVGTIGERGSQIVYQEMLFDTSKPGDAAAQRVLAMEANCTRTDIAAAPAPAPYTPAPTSAPAPAPAPTPAYNPGGGDAVVLDTGAEMSSVNATFANQLIMSGQAVELAPLEFTMANGSKEMERVISVKSLTIGSHTRTNVSVSVSKDGGMTLLGLPVLNAIGKFTIDAGSNQLIFG